MAIPYSSDRMAIGIDLGTTFTCLGVYLNGRVDIIANDQGNRTTPSYVAFTELERLIGEGAKAQATVNPMHTVYDIKRLIGRKYHDEIVQQDIQDWPFTVVDEGGSPYVEVIYKNEKKVFCPEQISSMILAKMKDIADSYLGENIVDAVITVPAYFTDGQRQATKDAGEIAGMNVLKIINEPTAAAIAYGIDKNINDPKNVLVFDLGGGTFDVAIVAISDRKYEVKAVGGDTHLGGSDFDTLLVKHFLAVIREKHKVDLSTDSRALGRLRSRCEIVKRNLSTSYKERVDIECLIKGTDFRDTITRNKFENICMPLFEKTIEHVKQTLIDAQLSPDQIDDVVLVGGSSRIPKIQEMLANFFGDKKLTKSINPDEAIAHGAAVEAAILFGEESIEHHSLEDVIPISISVGNSDGSVTVGMKKNTKIPASHTLTRTTNRDYQTSATFKIYEGEHMTAKDNNLLGSFKLNNIEHGRKGVPKFALKFSVDENGILHTSAIDTKTKDSNGITITENKGRLNRESLDRMIEEEQNMSKEDETQKRRMHLQNSLETFCLTQETQLNASLKKTSSTEKQKMLDACNQALEWLEKNPEASVEDYENKLRDVEQVCSKNK